jgi:hypothetical protein
MDHCQNAARSLPPMRMMNSCEIITAFYGYT